LARGPSVQIEEQIYLFGVNETGEGRSWPTGLDLVKFIAAALYVTAPWRAVIGSRAEGDNLEKFSIVHGE
jgi:hypothetical protein